MVTRKSPIRTCIGCRKRVAAGELFRVVVAPDPTSGETSVVVPDPRHRMPGRGAWLHPDPACVELAQRRRAFARALRVPATIDPGAVHSVFRYVTEHNKHRTTAVPQDGRETGIPAGGTP